MRLASVTQGLRPKGVVNIMARVISEGTTVSGSANSLASAGTTATCSCIAEHVQVCCVWPVVQSTVGTFLLEELWRVRHCTLQIKLISSCSFLC